MRTSTLPPLGATLELRREAEAGDSQAFAPLAGGARTRAAVKRCRVRFTPEAEADPRTWGSECSRASRNIS